MTLCTLTRDCYFTEFVQLYEIVENLWLDLPHRYEDLSLDEYMIMPNHFHGVIVTHDSDHEPPFSSKPALGNIIGSFKSLCVTSWLKTIKSQGIKAGGKFWQDNYFEHIIRNELELDRIREYIQNNPLEWELDPENRANLGKTRPVAEKWMV